MLMCDRWPDVREVMNWASPPISALMKMNTPTPTSASNSAVYPLLAVRYRKAILKP